MKNDVRRCHVILAIDAFEKELALSRVALRELHYWAKKLGTRIEAVHVLSGSDQDPRFNQNYTRAYDLLVQRVKRLSLGVPVQVKVIWDHQDLIQHPAHTLVDYAKDSKADLVLVSSHGRKWFSRMVFGSFAEKLLQSSPVPLLFFGRNPDREDLFRRVLFCTDFSDSSKMAFLHFLKQVRPIQPEVVIFHAAEYPNFVTGMSLTGVGAYLPDAYWKVMKESLVSEGESWVKLAEEEGVRARALIEEGVGDVSGSIQKIAASEQVSLIGMASVRGEFQRMVLGSISKQIFRSSRHSVWVCGPKALDHLTSTESPMRPKVSPPDLRSAGLS